MKKITWYNELGFFSNPFSTKPAAFHDELIGYESLIEEIIDKVAESNVIFISGKYGTGKTTILKKVIDEFKRGGKVIYYNCNQSDRSIDFDKLLVGSNFFRKLFRIRKKKMIILLDEAQDMNIKDREQIKKYYYEGFFKSVVFAGKKDDIDLVKELEDLIGENKFRIDIISKTDAVKMIRKRIGNLKFISEQNIIKIFNKNKNPRAFLRNCEDICRYAFENGETTVTEKHINKKKKNHKIK